ncbi:MAG: phosphate acyltransferase PlsX [Coriobacteriia bacterium]|nr:phosphate acyltransferase PlsX [Coriobacteriia bacterium]MBS5478444.1 phosphate acyltransferase PlsX [Coriobacteriia bacterium]
MVVQQGTTEPVSVVVDVMGGDEPPQVVLEGIERALAADAGLTVIACGPAELVEPFAASHERCEAHACTQVIGMEEHPVEAIRSKRDSSIVVGCRLVREGRAQGFFSAGSTGACMSAATLVVGRIKGIDRPALTTALPGTTPTVFLDMGANADCKPNNIVQFAHMGCAYAKVVLGVDEPRVGLLNIGSEDTKGSMEAQARFAALKEQVPAFVGNAEGTDLMGDAFDVIVTDGFTGNIALKTMEGTTKFVLKKIKQVATSSLSAKIGGALLHPALSGLKAELSGDEYGGAVLLGVKGVVVIGHGATSPDAVMNGTLVATNAARGHLVERIGELCA